MNATFRKAAIKAGVPLDTMRKLVVAAREDHLDLVADSATRHTGRRGWTCSTASVTTTPRRSSTWPPTTPAVTKSGNFLTVLGKKCNGRAAAASYVREDEGVATLLEQSITKAIEGEPA